MKNHLNDNATLVSRLITGDEKAYAYLLDNYHHRLCVYANSLVNDSLSAEDIVQNVFIKIWKRREKLKIKVSLESLLYRSVYNEFIDQYRTNMAILKAEQHYYNHLNTIVEEYDNDKIEKAVALVNEVVKNLPSRCREVFELSKTDGLTNVEIANHLNISIKTVESQMTKAFSRIREKLSGKIKSILFFLFNFRIKKSLKI